MYNLIKQIIYRCKNNDYCFLIVKCRVLNTKYFLYISTLHFWFFDLLIFWFFDFLIFWFSDFLIFWFFDFSINLFLYFSIFLFHYFCISLFLYFPFWVPFSECWWRILQLFKSFLTNFLPTYSNFVPFDHDSLHLISF